MFWKRKKIPLIGIGSKWTFKSDKSPWPEKDARPVTVLDCKDGWVRYDMGFIFTDERMKIGSFLYCYKELI